MEELFEKDWLDYEPPKFGSFKWLETQSGYQKIGELIKEKPAIKTALKDILCMSVQSALANVDTRDRKLTIPVVMPSLLDLDFKQMRKAKGLTLRDVQESTSISNAYLSQLETGKIKSPGYNTVKALYELYSNEA